MTTAVLERRIAKLESEMRSLRSALPKISKQRPVLPTGKHLFASVKLAERDVIAGRVLRGNLRELAK